jgi:hypothetical protein
LTRVRASRLRSHCPRWVSFRRNEGSAARTPWTSVCVKVVTAPMAAGSAVSLSSSDPPLVSRAPLIRSLWTRKVLDGQDERGVHARVQTRGGRPVGKQPPAADADRGRNRDPTLDAEAVALGANGKLLTTVDSRVTGSRACEPGGFPPDRAAEIARLRRELDQTRMKRDALKERSASSRRCPSDVRLHRAACEHLAGASDVPRARRFPQRLLRLAVTPESARSVSNRQLLGAFGSMIRRKVDPRHRFPQSAAPVSFISGTLTGSGDGIHVRPNAARLQK